MPIMPTQERPTGEELDRRVRHAWASYSASLRDLQGREYEEAETQAWERLQRRLAEIGRPFG
jgi:N-formylglutamate amidohydrolase